MHGAIAVDVINKRNLIGLLDVHFLVLGGNVDEMLTACHVKYALYNALKIKSLKT